MNDTLQTIEDAWFAIDSDFEAMYDAAPPNRKTELRELRDSARDAYWMADEQRLRAGDAMVSRTRSELKAATEELKAIIEDMDDFTQYIETLTKVVNLLGALVTFATV